MNDEVAGLARIGPIHNQAQAVMRVLKSPETAVHLVTLLEEMPVQETADGIAELRAAELPVGRVVVNMVRPHLLDEDALRTASGAAARRSRRRSPGPGSRVPRRWSDRSWSRPPSTPSGSAWNASSARCWRDSGCPWPSSLISEGVTPAALNELAEEFRKQGVGDESADAAGQTPGGGNRRGSAGGVVGS